MKKLSILLSVLCIGCSTSKIITSTQNALNSKSILLLPSMNGIEMLTNRKENEVLGMTILDKNGLCLHSNTLIYNPFI